MENIKGYPQVIEWEYIDSITTSNSEISVALVFFITDILNNDDRFSNAYKFEVIPYGYIGFYAATGVEFINGNETEIDDDYIQSDYFQHIKNIKMGDFIDYSIKNRERIRAFFKMVDKSNNDLFNNIKT